VKWWLRVCLLFLNPLHVAWSIYAWRTHLPFAYTRGDNVMDAAGSAFVGVVFYFVYQKAYPADFKGA